MRLQTKSSKTDPKPSAPISAPGRWPLTHARGPVRPSLRAGLVAGAAFAVVIAVAAGFAIRSLTTPDAPPPAPAPLTATAGPVTMTVDGDWVPARTVPGVEGLDLNSTAAFSPSPGLRAYAVTTVGPIGDPSLLPAPLRALLPDELPKPKASELLGLAAWYYKEQAIAGGRQMEVTVVPTTSGVLAVACIAPRESWVAALGCAEGVKQLSLRDAGWLKPGADVAAQARLPLVTAKLNARRVALRKQLRGAKTRKGQARFAKRLSKANAAAAAGLAPVAPAKSPSAKVIASLRKSSAAYRGLAAAAANGWPKRYRMAKKSVKRSDAALKRALASAR